MDPYICLTLCTAESVVTIRLEPETCLDQAASVASMCRRGTMLYLYIGNRMEWDGQANGRTNEAARERYYRLNEEMLVKECSR